MDVNERYDCNKNIKFTSISGHGKTCEQIVLTVNNHVDLRSVKVVVSGIQTRQLANIPHDRSTLRDESSIIDTQSRNLSKSQLAIHFKIVKFVGMHAKVV